MPSGDGLQTAFFLHQKGNLAEAAKIYRALIETDHNNFHALHFLGVIEATVGNIERAKVLVARSMAIQPPNIQFIENYATILLQAGELKPALEVSQQGLQIDNANTSLLYVSAISLFKLSRLHESIAQFDKLLLLQPNHIIALNERASVLAEMADYDAALACVEKALLFNPRYAEAQLNKGNLYGKLKRYEEAIGSYETALGLKPDLANAWLGLGNVLNEVKRYEEAFRAYDKTIALKPDLAEAWHGRGNVFVNLKRYDEAFGAYDKALALRPGLANAWYGRGFIFNKLKRHEEAAHAYAEVLKIDPNHPFTKGKLLHQKMLSCEWTGVSALIAEINEDVFLGKLSAHPFGWQGVGESERSLQLCAELFNKRTYPPQNKIHSRKPVANHKKIRIGYSSGELRDQATSHLSVGLFELHDNACFEIYGIDNGWDDQSEIRQRINASVHRTIDISQLTDTAAAVAIAENEIDILVNLNGYFGEERTGVFANRGAPIQVSYLGFPGTLGADYMDYIIADKHVIPEKHKEFYTEKVIYLPNCYQVNDNKKKIGACNLTRSELGLPEKGFVFCCFNNNYKILPEVFDCWMRLLRKVDGSVLWLIEDNAAVAVNLRKEAVARSVNPERLIFAKRIPLSEHLARHCLADLFLDTLPYNAHTTASDALWTGLPVLTCLGETFAGRVGASLLNAIGLPELITTTLETYEQMAIDLATHPEKLLAVKRKVAENRHTTPLFDTKLFIKHIEAAYTMIYERYQNGLAPDHIIIRN
jgi:protein O-GlcNAc transferase